MKRHLQQSFNIYWPLLALIGIYICLRLPYFMLNAFLPDEYWFVRDAKRAVLQGNYIGYGMNFWVFLAFIRIILGKTLAFFALRLTVLASICVSFYFMTRLSSSYSTSKKITFLTLLAFISLPMFMYGGRLIAPEFYQLALITVSSYFLLKKEYSTHPVWWGLLGFALGLKISALPAIFFVGTMHLYVSAKQFSPQQLYKMAIWIAIGFIISNPILFYSPVDFLENISSQVNHNQAPLLHNLKYHFMLRRESWDLADTSGITHAVIPLASLIIVSVLTAISNWKVFLIYIVSLAMYLLMLALNPVFLPWYGFLIPFMAFTSLILSQPDKIGIISIASLLCVFIINAIPASQLIVRDYHARILFAQNLADRDYYQQCAIETFQTLNNYHYVINWSEIGVNAKRKEVIKPQALHTDALIYTHPGTEVLINDLLAGHSVIFMTNKRRALYPYGPDKIEEIRRFLPEGSGTLNANLMNECKEMLIYELKVE